LFSLSLVNKINNMRKVFTLLLAFFCIYGFSQNISQLNHYKYFYVMPAKAHKPGDDSKCEEKIKSLLINKGCKVILNKDSVPSADLLIVVYRNEKKSEDGEKKAKITRKKIDVNSTVNFLDQNSSVVFSCQSTDTPKFGEASYDMSRESVNASYLMNAMEPAFKDYVYIYKKAEDVAVSNVKRETEKQPEKQPEKETVKKEKPAVVKKTSGKKAEEPLIVDATEGGNYYALLIGVSDYVDAAIPDLENQPIKDVEKLAAVLQSKYTFNKDNITSLKNPSRRELVIALDNLSKNITSEDNVLIFYAGHGHYEEDSQIGYWLPKDAEVANTSNWLYNDQLVASIKKIKSKHTLLITDACFSGSIFKTRAVNMEAAGDAIKKKYELPSRKAITSGTLKTVPNVSVFMKYLLDRLAKNSDKYFSASQLFQSIEIPVGNNSPTTPQYGVIQNVGDEGGDFIFIKK